jgi:hypothetical protein
MPQSPASQFSVQLAAIAGDVAGPEVVEQFALELRAELAAAGATRVDDGPMGEAPRGARGLEILSVCTLIVTVVQTAEAAGKAVAAIRRVAARYAQRRQRIRVTLAGVDVDLAQASDEEIMQAVLAQPRQATTGARSALIIANAHYDDPGLAQLRAPGHDGQALTRVLGDPQVGGFDVALLQDSDERTIRRRIAAFFAKRDRDDVLLLHFSCHGVKDMRGRLHLAARDTDLALLGATAIPASFIHDQLAMTQSRRVVLILDCCYSGAFARGSTVRGGSGDVPIADEFGAGAGRIVLTASSATEYAFEGGELTQSAGQPSAFTGALVQGLETGAADLDADGEVSVDELYDYTYRAVRAVTPGQAPMKWSFGAEGNLVIARSRRPAALPRPLVEDLRSDRVPLRLAAVTELARLGHGGKPRVREAAYAALTELRDNDDSERVRRAAADALADRHRPVPLSPQTSGQPASPVQPGTPPTIHTAGARVSPASPYPSSSPGGSTSSPQYPAAPSPTQGPGTPLGYGRPPPSKQNNNLGLLGMIFGIAGLLLSALGGLFALPFPAAGIVLGVLGLRRVAAGRATNHGMAWTGIICGSLAVVLAMRGVMVLAG